MITNFSDFFHPHLVRINSAETPDAVMNAVLTGLHDTGLTGVVYSGSHAIEPLFAGADHVKAWIDHFIKHNYFETDPLYIAAKASVSAQYWKAHQQLPNYTAEQIQMYQEIGSFGIAQGFDVSVHDAESNASLCFYFATQEPILKDTPVQSLCKVVAIYAHNRVKQLYMNEKPLPNQQTIKALTAREKDCLLLIANGKNKNEVAEILNISVRTVTYHLQNVKDKLNAQTLPHAVSIFLLNQQSKS